MIDRPGGIFVRQAEQISSEDRILFQSVARAVITDGRGTLAEQLDRRGPAEPRVPRLAPSRAHRPEPSPAGEPPRRRSDPVQRAGRIHPRRARIRHHARARSSDAGAVGERAGESVLRHGRLGERRRLHLERERARIPPHALAQRSGQRCERRSPLPARRGDRPRSGRPRRCPRAAATPYVIRHGFGYSVFETRVEGIRSELWVYVAIDAAVKFSVLKVRNESGRPRRLSATGYVEWVLGDLRAKSAMHVITEIDRQSGALFARNPYNTEFADRVAFFDVDDPTRNVTGDRTEFLGRNGTLRNPAAMTSIAPVRQGRRRPRSLRRDPGELRSGRRGGARDRLPARRRAQCR